MNRYLDAATADQLTSQLPHHRSSVLSDDRSADERLSSCCSLMEAYLALGLADRAGDWLRVGDSLCDEHTLSTVAGRFGLARLEVSLDQGDRDGALRALEGLKNWTEPDAESERRLLAAQVRLAFLADQPEPFAALERALRNLRLHPSPRWACRLHLWKAHWQISQGREPEALASLRKALTEAEEAQDPCAALDALLGLAELKPLAKAKALRYAREALEKALLHGVPAAEERARQVLVQAGGARREADSSGGWAELLECARRNTQSLVAMDRAAREADAVVLEKVRQGRHLLESSTLAFLAARLAGDLGLAECFDGLYAPLRKLMVADVFGIALWVPEQDALDYSLFIEDGRRTRVGLIPVQSTRSLGAWCFREGRGVRVNDIETEYSAYLHELSKLADHRPKSMLFQPLVSGSTRLGIVTVQSFTRGSYSADTEALFSVLASCLSLRLQRGSRSEA